MTQAEALASICAQINQQAINTLSENLARALVEIDELKAAEATRLAAAKADCDAKTP